jgi:hypothetical protein
VDTGFRVDGEKPRGKFGFPGVLSLSDNQRGFFRQNARRQHIGDMPDGPDRNKANDPLAVRKGNTADPISFAAGCTASGSHHKIVNDT